MNGMVVAVVGSPIAAVIVKAASGKHGKKRSPKAKSTSAAAGASDPD